VGHQLQRYRRPTTAGPTVKLRRQTYAQEDALTVKFSETDEEIHVEDSLVLTRFAIMGMFDEADEITLPFGSLHQFQTILDVMENQELVLKDEQIVYLSSRS
jgi:hypothetical protein